MSQFKRRLSLKIQNLKFFQKAAVSNKGIAYVEMLPLIILFVMLFGLTFGLWTSIHNGTLRSIAARHYAFEVLNNRTHFVYHRDTSEGSSQQYYKKNAYRVFLNVKHQTASNPENIPESNPLSLFDQGILKTKPSDTANSKFPQSNPIYLKMGYGICIDSKCGEP